MGFLDSLKEKIIGENVEEETDEGLYPIEDEVEGEGEGEGDGQGNQPGQPGQPGNGAGGKHDHANQIIDGETYYREVLEDYKDQIKEYLEKNRDTLSDDEIAMIEQYLGIV